MEKFVTSTMICTNTPCAAATTTSLLRYMPSRLLLKLKMLLLIIKMKLLLESMCSGVIHDKLLMFTEHTQQILPLLFPSSEPCIITCYTLFCHHIPQETPNITLFNCVMNAFWCTCSVLIRKNVTFSLNKGVNVQKFHRHITQMFTLRWLV